MNNYILESNVPFVDSIIWKLNRSYYEQAGLSAWSDGVVPHSLTSSAFVGKTYAALILGFLKDTSRLAQIAATYPVDEDSNEDTLDKCVYILELGAGHGRLAFHILQHLDRMVAQEKDVLPDYCFVVTDIVESNLEFFQNHVQFSNYIKQGKLDIAYYDGVTSKEIKLRNAKKTITPGSLAHPIVAIANYFFDSLPVDLYKIENDTISACHISVSSALDPAKTSYKDLLEGLTTEIEVDNDKEISTTFLVGNLLSEYVNNLNDTYLLMPRLSVECIETIKQYSKKGVMVISLDKGYHEMSALENQPQPELIKHGSFSLYVNFHALSRYCDKAGGKSFFNSATDFSSTLGCLILCPEAEHYTETYNAYSKNVDTFGPDDFIVMKDVIMKHASTLTLREIISSLRLGCYDSTLFLHLLPYLKEETKSLTAEDRNRLAETLTKVDASYFAIKERIDTSYEIGGLLYDLGYYRKALRSFKSAGFISGELADLYYNMILCYYQLREDRLFKLTLTKAKLAFPHYEKFDELAKLDLNAV